MKVKVLAEHTYQVVAVVHGDRCDAEDFLLTGDATTSAMRRGLFEMLKAVAERGLQGVPSLWWHEVDKPNGIYEFSKGALRLFFFKGADRQIAVCVSGIRKTSQKVDKGAVRTATSTKANYFNAVQSGNCEVIDEAE